MPRRALLVLLVFVSVLPAAAGVRARVRLCKASCSSAIQACVTDGGRPRACKRQVRRRCKREGVAVCIPPGTHLVATTGVDAPTCGTADAPCRTIQFAVDQLIPYGGAGTVKVAAGTFADVANCNVGTANQAVVCVVNRQVTLIGGFVPPNWDVPASPSATVIDAQGRGRGVRVVRGSENGEVASLDMQGFTIQNGMVQGASAGTLADTWAFGGGMLVESSPLTLRGMVFRDNEARGGATAGEGGRGVGGALAVYSVWPSVVAPATLSAVSFIANHASGGAGHDAGGYALGGAVFTYAVPLVGDVLVFEDNTATAGSSDGTRTSGDKGDALGGAFGVGQDGQADLHHVRATGNVATGGDAPNGEAGGAFGGAFFAESADLALRDSTLAGNRAQGGNGHNTTTTGSIAQGGAAFATLGVLTLDRVVVLGNEARAGDGEANGGVAEGGGLAVTMAERNGVATPYGVTNSVVADNLVSIGAGTPMGGGGGGMFFQGASGSLDQTTVANNRLGDPRLLGSGVCLFDLPGWSTQIAISNGIFANHTTPGLSPSCRATSALWLAQSTSATVDRILFANNVHDSNDGAAGGCNVYPGSFSMAGVIAAGDAGFASAGLPDEDYHLTAGSPAVDQASVGVAMDLDGTARPYGPSSDLGAYEFRP